MAPVTVVRPRIVIIGGGFGGITATRALKRANADVVLVDRTNHHLFQPLLYQVASASLAPSDISAPLRHMLHKQRNASVILAEVTHIDVHAKTVRIDRPARDITYDYLIVATGSRHAYFGHPEWEKFAPGLKAIEDATEIRRRFLLAFERADKVQDPAERDQYLTFVVVGGGPTGAELCGSLSTVAQKALSGEFRNIDTRSARVILLEGGPAMLPTFPTDLAEKARKGLEELGVEVRTNSIVTDIDENAVHIGDEKILTHTVFWAAGNVASPLGKSLGVPLDSAGRVCVNPDLSIPGHPEVFVVGDLAYIERENGEPVPGVSPAANQEGARAASNIRRLMGRLPTELFHYRNKGDLAVIGRSRAIADFGKIRLSGRIAWLLWLFVHILYLVGFRNRISVLLQWAYNYLTYQGGARLITNTDRLDPAPEVD